MNRSILHINQVGYLNPLFDALRQSGVNLESIKKKSDLKHFDIQNVDSYVPVKVLEAFLVKIYDSQGLSHLDKQLIEQFELNDMGEFGEFLMTLPDALSMVNESIKLEPIVCSNCKSQLIVNGVESYYHWKFINQFSMGRTFSEEFCFMMVMSGLKSALGANYNISSIHIPRYQYRSLKYNFPSGDYKLVLTDNHYAIGFPTGLLSRSTEKDNTIIVRPNLPIQSCRSKLTMLFNGLEEGIMPTLDLLALQSDMSTRGLNRRLAKEGTSFRELLNIHVLNKALYYLEETNTPIDIISKQLGYNHVSNFIRAFNKIVHITPLQYRMQLAATG